MSKYIDLDNLKAEIERRLESYDPDYTSAGRELNELLSFITSLQQEQPKSTCKNCGFYENNCPFIRGELIPYPNNVCKDYIYSAMKEQEQPEVDLEKEESVGVAESPLKTFQRVNDFESGGGYRH